MDENDILERVDRPVNERSAFSTGQITASVRSAFGVFVSDALLDDRGDDGDHVELLIASGVTLGVLWAYLELMIPWVGNVDAFLRGASAPHWKVAEIALDFVQLVESVVAILMVRIMTEAAESIVGATATRASYAAVSIAMFVVTDAFAKSRRRVPGGTSVMEREIGKGLADGSLPVSSVVWSIGL